MNLTTADISRIRAVAEADRAGADGKAWDETVTPDVVIALCDLAGKTLKMKDYGMMEREFREWKEKVWKRMSQWRM